MLRCAPIAAFLALAACAPARIPLDEVVGGMSTMDREKGEVRIGFRIASDAECVGVRVEGESRESKGEWLVARSPLPRVVIENDAPYMIQDAGGAVRATGSSEPE